MPESPRSEYEKWRRARQDEIVSINKKLDELRARRTLIQNQLRNGRTFIKHTGKDYEYFRARDLIVYIDRYLSDSEETQLVLCERAGITTRTLRRILHLEGKLVTFKTADRLFTAMGIPKVLDTLDKTMIGKPPEKYWED